METLGVSHLPEVSAFSVEPEDGVGGEEGLVTDRAEVGPGRRVVVIQMELPAGARVGWEKGELLVEVWRLGVV